MKPISAFVLCGGLGTRLQDAVPDVPKALAPVGGRPFLDMLVETLRDGGVGRVVMLAGHRAEQIVRHVDVLVRDFPGMHFEMSIEPHPLGTAGALRYAADLLDGPALLVNGDTHVEVDAREIFAAHLRAGAAVTIGAARVVNAQRFGTIDASLDGTVRGFREKGDSGTALVNAGVYVVEPRIVEGIEPGVAVSLERDTLPALIASGERVHAFTLPGSFVDIGTPDSYSAFSAEAR